MFVQEAEPGVCQKRATNSRPWTAANSEEASWQEHTTASARDPCLVKAMGCSEGAVPETKSVDADPWWFERNDFVEESGPVDEQVDVLGLPGGVKDWGTGGVLECYSDEDSDGEEVSGTRIEDGGGIFSDGDWLNGKEAESSRFRGLRVALLQHVEAWGLEQRIRTGFSKGGAGLLSQSERKMVRDSGVAFLQQAGYRVSAAVTPGQPFALDILRGLAELSEDMDSGLPSILEEGVPTGVLGDIQECKAYQREDRSKKLDVPVGDGFQLCDRNWRSAESEPEKVRELLEAEIAQGWMEKWHGGLEAASARWGDLVAVGKLAVVEENGKDPRLVGDSTAAGVSPVARFPNRMKHPRLRDLRRGLRRCRRRGGKWVAVTLDVKAAHKRMLVRESDAGLSFFRVGEELFRYMVCHFGASWSAFWWGRVSGLLVRLLHRILGSDHVALSYVDDTVIFVREDKGYQVAALAAVFFELLGAPLSYHKLAVGKIVEYIGFWVDAGRFSLGVSDAKSEKLRGFLGTLRQGDRVDRGKLEQGVGSLQWVSELVPVARPWLSEMYRLVNKPGLVWLTLGAEKLNEVFAAIDGEGVLRRPVPGTRLRPGLVLSYVGKHRVKASECWKNWCSGVGGCVGFADWESRRVKISPSVEEASWVWWRSLETPSVLEVCRDRPLVGGMAAADAMATGSFASLGGWWADCSEWDQVCWDDVWWFRLELGPDDISRWFQLAGDWGLDIAFFEALAQLILLVLRCHECPGNGGSRWHGGQLSQACDNETVVGAHKKRLSTADPLCFMVQALEFWKKQHDVEVSAYKACLGGTFCFICWVAQGLNVAYRRQGQHFGRPHI